MLLGVNKALFAGSRYGAVWNWLFYMVIVIIIVHLFAFGAFLKVFEIFRQDMKLLDMITHLGCGSGTVMAEYLMDFIE